MEMQIVQMRWTSIKTAHGDPVASMSSPVATASAYVVPTGQRKNFEFIKKYNKLHQSSVNLEIYTVFLWSSKIRCDRRNDCGDGSDERGCTYQTCQQHQFACQNGRCVSRDFVCDGDNDCGDESDELEHMCHTPAPTCPPAEFRCENGHCIPQSQVCNRNDDCSDNSDEKGCGECEDMKIVCRKWNG